LNRDTTILRDLARRYVEVCSRPEQDIRRALWTKHNSLKPTRPLIYVRAFAWSEMPDAECAISDPFLRHFEDVFRRKLFWSTLDDDSVFEPWVTLTARYRWTGWGVSGERHFSKEPRGSFKVEYPLKKLEDVSRLRVPVHSIDELGTASDYERLGDAVGDIITIDVDRAPAYRMWSGDISTDLGYLRGIEHFMMDMVDDPEGLRRLVKFMSDGILKTHDEAEQGGDWGLSSHQNQAMPYAEELPDPKANTNGVKRSCLWAYMAAQEFTAVSPSMHEEFLLRYQLPILNHFGLVAYGCCEDLTHKIGMLRQIPNLRRIAVSPFANVKACAEQIGKDYVISYRPSPSDMVGYGFDESRVRTILSQDLIACRGCHVDVTLKDVETVQGDHGRVRRWVSLTRKVIDEVWK